MNAIAAGTGRPYVEAFPVISLNSVRRVLRDGRRIFQWVNEHGTIIGHVEIVEQTPAHLVIRHKFFGTPNVSASSGTTTFDVKTRYANEVRDAIEIICPRDGRPSDKIYFAQGTWACRYCHHLGHLIQRLSPHHKIIVRIDALTSKLQQDSARKRRPRSYKNDLLTLKKLRQTAGPLRELPEQLRFRSDGRWLDDDELPKQTVEPGDQGYGWSPGDRSGFKAFWAELPATVAIPQRYRISLPADPLLKGGRLFQHDIMKFMAERFANSALSAGSRAIARNPQITLEELAGAIEETVRISPLSIADDEVTIAATSLPGGNVQLATTLSYSGDVELWSCKVPRTSSSPKLRAIIEDEQLVLKTETSLDRVAEADRALTLAIALVRQQIAAQCDLLSRFNSAFPDNAAQFAQVLIDRHESSKGFSGIKVGFEPFD